MGGDSGRFRQEVKVSGFWFRILEFGELDKEEIRRRIIETGAVAVGFAMSADVDSRVMSQYKDWIGKGCHAGMDYLQRHVALKANLESVLPNSATVISVAFSYAPDRLRDSRLPQIACYAYGDDYHDVLRHRLTPVVESLRQTLGGEWRICIDSAPVAERYWALRSGIGIRGMNGSVIVGDAGGYVFLAEIITTVPISADEPSHGECEKCGACVKACPQNALQEDGSVDSRCCLNYLTIEHKGEWQEGLAGHMQGEVAGNTLYGCDICLRVCPHNINRVPTRICEFEPRERIMRLTADEAAAMTQEEFSTVFKGSPIKRAKLSGLRRNARNVLKQKG